MRHRSSRELARVYDIVFGSNHARPRALCDPDVSRDHTFMTSAVAGIEIDDSGRTDDPLDDSGRTDDAGDA